MEGFENPTIAQMKYRAAKANFDHEWLIAFAVRECYAVDEKKARRALDGLLQWLACSTMSGHCDNTFVMMKGPVERMYQAFLANTALYMRFCEEFIGFYMHHQPITEEITSKVNLNEAISHTIKLLSDSYGDDLAPALQSWIESHERKSLYVSSVSCPQGNKNHYAEKLASKTHSHPQWEQETLFSAVD